MAKKPEGPEWFSTSVAGVTFEGRQRVLKKHRRDGDQVLLEREPDNERSKYAVAVWVRKRAWIFKGRAKAGYIPRDKAPKISRLIAAGYSVNARIDAVYGGGWGKNLGMRLAIEMRPPKG